MILAKTMHTIVSLLTARQRLPAAPEAFRIVVVRGLEQEAAKIQTIARGLINACAGLCIAHSYGHPIRFWQQPLPPSSSTPCLLFLVHH